jgi:hypothetical protein
MAQFNISSLSQAIGISEPPHRKFKLAFAPAGIYLPTTKRFSQTITLGTMKEDAMNSSQTICPTWDDLGSDNIVSTPIRYRSTMLMAYLKALVTPEPSDDTAVVSDLPPGRLFGAVKASLWAFAAVGTGIVLAFICT